MKHNLRKPCSECPFLKSSVKGWLGPDRVGDVLHDVHGEAGYPCHMDVSKVLAGKPEIFADPDAVEQCAGAILHATKSLKLYRPGPLRAHQDILDGASLEIVLDVSEFREHHKGAGQTGPLRRK